MTASAGDRQLASIIERILRLKADQDDIADDVKEVYAEAKDNGYDKTALGEIVSLKRKEARNPQAFAERSIIVQTYLDAIERVENPSHTHAPAREGRGEAKLVETIAQAVQTETGKKALLTAVDAMIEIEEERETRKARAAARTTEAMEDNIAFSEEVMSAGIFTPEQHAENVALSKAVDRKFGTGKLEIPDGVSVIRAGERIRVPMAEYREAEKAGRIKVHGIGNVEMTA